MTVNAGFYLARANRGLFALQLLLELAKPVTDKNMIALLAWMQGEDTRARYNPLATTRKWPGATDFNTAGVRNYPTLAAGIHATVATITNGHYAPILDALSRGDSVQRVAHAVEASPWGTEHVPWRDVNARPAAYASHLVAP